MLTKTYNKDVFMLVVVKLMKMPNMPWAVQDKSNLHCVPLSKLILV